MGKFLDALLNKKSLQSAPSMFVGQSAATEGQPVPVAMIIQPPSKLSSDAALNNAAIGAWPELVDAGAKFWTIGGWRKNRLVQPHAQNMPGNYGMVTSQALFGFLFRAFDGIGNYANEGYGNPYIKEYNELTPITWGLRVSNPNTVPNTTAQKGPISIQTKSSVWQGPNTASLNVTGELLL